MSKWKPETPRCIRCDSKANMVYVGKAQKRGFLINYWWRCKSCKCDTTVGSRDMGEE